jgi:hypothetical protein
MIKNYFKYSSLRFLAIISVIFLFCLTTSTELAANQNREYKVPRNSISYFHENTHEHHKQDVKVVSPPAARSSLRRTPVHRENNQTNFSKASNAKPFAKTLARMQRRSAQRKAEAEKLGIVLPSQGGDMGAVSPSLNRLNKAINDIMSQRTTSGSGTNAPPM